jgi:hypothetical protein
MRVARHKWFVHQGEWRPGGFFASCWPTPQDVCAFLTEVGPESVIGVNTTADGYIVWYWSDEPDTVVGREA